MSFLDQLLNKGKVCATCSLGSRADRMYMQCLNLITEIGPSEPAVAATRDCLLQCVGTLDDLYSNQALTVLQGITLLGSHLSARRLAGRDRRGGVSVGCLDRRCCVQRYCAHNFCISNCCICRGRGVHGNAGGGGRRVREREGSADGENIGVGNAYFVAKKMFALMSIISARPRPTELSWYFSQTNLRRRVLY